MIFKVSYMMSRRKEKRLSIAILLVIASIIAVTIISFLHSQRVKATSSRINYTKDVLLRLNDLYNTVIDHAGHARSYAMEGKNEHVNAMQSSASLLLAKLDRLQTHINNNPAEQALTDSLEKYLRKRVEHSSLIIATGREKGLAAATTVYNTGAGREYNNLVFSFINQLQADELNTLQLNEQKNAAASNQLSYYLTGLLVFTLALVIFIILKIRMEVSARNKTEAQLKQFNELLEEQVKVKTAAIKKSEERLEISEKNLRQVLASTAENFYVVDKTYTVTLINEAAQRNHHKAWGKLITPGMNILEHTPAEELKQVKRSFERAFAGEKTWFEFAHTAPELPGCMLVSFLPVFDEQGKTSAVCVLAKDITEWKKAEREKENATALLNERVKELTVLHRVSQLLQKEEMPVETLLQRIVSILPAGWQFPEVAAARINWGDAVFVSAHYKPSGHKQTIGFHCFDGTTGLVEVVYTEERPVATEGPFLPEERNLLNMVAEMLQTYFNRRHAEEKLKQSYQEIRQLASYIEQAREEEKIRIAREIHDELGQQLTGLKMDIAWLLNKINPSEEPIQKKLRDVTVLLDEIVQSVRRISSDLRPGILDDLGLVPAIRWQSNEFEKRSGIRTEFIGPEHDLEIPTHLYTGIFRIFQESLTNVARHANASKVTTILLATADQLELKITDNGTGFDVSSIGHKRTLGLLGMKERTALMGGHCEIISRKGEGTSVYVSVPLLKKHQELFSLSES